MKKYFFAVDLGATSGRTILGTLVDGHLEQEELTRFPNNLIETGGHFYWDIYALYFEMIRGLKEVAHRGITLTSIGIDTWGVDFDRNTQVCKYMSDTYVYKTFSLSFLLTLLLVCIIIYFHVVKAVHFLCAASK